MRSIAILLLLGACTGDDKDVDAPTASELTLTPTTVVARIPAFVRGSIMISDVNGDVAQLGSMVRTPSGLETEPALVDIRGQISAPGGTVEFSLVATPPEPGAYTIEVWVIDEAGHESNREDGVIEAF